MILRIREERPSGQVGVLFYLHPESTSTATRWLITNGFQRKFDKDLHVEYWIREARSLITFRKGIFGDGRLVKEEANFTLRADIVKGIDPDYVICECCE